MSGSSFTILSIRSITFFTSIESSVACVMETVLAAVGVVLSGLSFYLSVDLFLGRLANKLVPVREEIDFESDSEDEEDDDLVIVETLETE